MIDCFIKILDKYKYEKGLNEGELAKELKVSPMTIFRWRRGDHKPLAGEQKRITDYINDNNTFIDPYEVVTEELVILQKKIDDLKQYLVEFNA